ncbi:hypothetical protein PanWU01x14_206450, partial [Parasponia andersonii]
MPSLRKGLISLRPHPNGEHDFASYFTFAAAVIESVPLWSQGTIRRDSGRNLVQVEDNSPHVIVSPDHLFVLDEDFESRGLNSILGEGENLVPLRVHPLLEVFSPSFVVPKFHFHVRIAARGDGAGRKIFGLDDSNIEIKHLLDEIVSARVSLAVHPPSSTVNTATNAATDARPALAEVRVGVFEAVVIASISGRKIIAIIRRRPRNTVVTLVVHCQLHASLSSLD